MSSPVFALTHQKNRFTKDLSVKIILMLVGCFQPYLDLLKKIISRGSNLSLPNKWKKETMSTLLKKSLLRECKTTGRYQSNNRTLRPASGLKRNPCEDSELTASARSVISTVHSRGVLEDRKLLVPTLIIISSGFLRSSGLIWSFMSCFVHPGKVAILTWTFYGFIKSVFCVLIPEDDEDVLCPVTTLFPFWLLPFLSI